MKAIRGNLMTLLFVLCIGLMFSPASAMGQGNSVVRIVFPGMMVPSSLNPVGSGARALGMGGAFMAVAGDAAAASWNPGGLIQLEKPEVSAVFSHVASSEKNTFGNEFKGPGAETFHKSRLNYLSVAYPFEYQRRNMIVSLNYQHLYDFNRDWRFDVNTSLDIFNGPVQYDHGQDGGLHALGLAYAAQITPDFSMGLTINYWGNALNKNEWKQKYRAQSNLLIGGVAGAWESVNTIKYSFDGWSANLGFLWRLSEHWTLGGVFKSPFTADIEQTILSRDILTYPSLPDFNTDRSVKSEFDGELDMPMSYGIGLAWRISDSWTLSADVYRTHWEAFEFRDEQGQKMSPITGRLMENSDIDPTTWFRVGVEHLHIRESICIPIRAGFFYDPAPADGAPDDYYGLSLGTGLAYKWFIFDIAWQYRFGDGVGSSGAEGSDFSQEIREHTVYTSLIVHF